MSNVSGEIRGYWATVPENLEDLITKDLANQGVVDAIKRGAEYYWDPEEPNHGVVTLGGRSFRFFVRDPHFSEHMFLQCVEALKAWLSGKKVKKQFVVLFGKTMMKLKADMSDSASKSTASVLVERPKRENRFILLLSDDEYMDLHNRSIAADLSMSAFIRRKLFKKEE